MGSRLVVNSTNRVQLLNSVVANSADGVEDMLAVVQDDENSIVADEPDHGVEGGPTRLVSKTEGTGRRDWHERGIGDGREFDIAHAVVEFGCELASHLDGQARLAGTARSGQGDEPVVVEASPYLVDFGTTSDKACQLGRKRLCERAALGVRSGGNSLRVSG